MLFLKLELCCYCRFTLCYLSLASDVVEEHESTIARGLNRTTRFDRLNESVRATSVW